jgi:hypothetical protein
LSYAVTLLGVEMTATRRRTKSAASSGSRSGRFLGKTKLDRNVLTFDKTRFLETGTERTGSVLSPVPSVVPKYAAAGACD